MIEDTLARQLHDKATRAGTLTEAERAHLEAWYEQQDQAEEALLASSTPQPPMTLQSLQGEVEAAVSRLGAVTQHIQALTDENEALRTCVITPLALQNGREGRSISRPISSSERGQGEK